MSVIEERDITDVVREHGAVVPEGVRVMASLVPDDDEKPLAEGYSISDVLAFGMGDWRYVGIVVKVLHGETALAVSSTWGVEHGCLAEDSTDAFEYVPEAMEGDLVLMGSSLWSVTKEVLVDAKRHVKAIGALTWEAIA